MFNDTNASRGGEGKVERRGLCGDVYLAGTPAQARIGDVKVGTSRPQGPDHAQHGAGESDAARAIYAARRDHRPRPQGPGVHEQAVRSGRPQGRPLRTDRELEAREALGPAHAAERLRGGRLVGGRRQACRRRLAAAFRLPRVVDRRPRLLPQRHAHLPLRPAAGQRPGQRLDGRLRGGQGEPAAAETASASTSFTPTTTAASRAATSASRRSSARRTTWGCSSPSRSPISPSTTGRCPPRPRRTATPSTPGSMSAWRATIPPWSSTP